MDTNKLKYLEMIQSIISRMSKNSFMLKGWSVTIFTCLIVITAKSNNVLFVALPIFPIIIFWFLDSYYLLQERLYRALYDEARKLNNEEIDFCLSANKFSNNNKNCFKSCLFSKTEKYFYISQILFYIFVVVIA